MILFDVGSVLAFVRSSKFDFFLNFLSLNLAFASLF